MTRSRRPSAQTTAVVLALAEQPTAWRYGNELPAGRPPRHLYRLTGSGRALAADLAAAPARRPARMDPPGRLLAAAVATLPDHRREWGMAMHALLAEVRDGRPGGGSRSAAPWPRCDCRPWVAA
jgi:PadR family transcriptional regulator, regulatory protein PadR